MKLFRGKRALAAVLAICFCFTAACFGNLTQASASTAPVKATKYAGVLKKAIAEEPAYLTSFGQSADVQMVKVLLNKAGIKYTFNATAKASDLSGKTLIMVVGGSSKGLGAAGIKAEDELVRTEAVIKKAKSLGMKIIAVHVGGQARRGELSDKFINAATPDANYIIVVSEGNKDGLFTKMAKKGGIPMDVVSKITAAIDPLKFAFGKK